MRCRQHRFFAVIMSGLFVFLTTHLFTSAAGARCTKAVKKQIERLNKSAMEDYDLLEFESAKQSLLDANRLARNKGCHDDIIAAKTYVSLAVLYIQGFKDESRGKLMFRRALRIAPKVTLDRQLATPKLMRLFNDVKDSMGLSTDSEDPGGDEPPIEKPRPVTRPKEPEKPAKGLEHKPIDEAPRKSPLEVKARVGDELGAARVVLFYKVAGMAEYAALPMQKVTEWTWKVEIPGNEVEGKMVYYYVEVRNKEGKPLAASGNAASPHIVMLTAPVPTTSGGDAETPFQGPGKKDKKKKDKKKPGDLIGIYIGLGGGLSTGYVGKWYGDLSDSQPKRPGFAMGTFDGMIEAGYFISPKMLASLFFKLGYAQSDMSEVPVLGWQVAARFRYVVLGSDPGSFFRLYAGAELGGGDIYHSLALDNKTDSFKSGPGMIIGALLGAWIGTEKVGGFIELDPKGVIDFTADTVIIDNREIQHGRQHTFSLGIAAGLYLSF